MSLRPVVRLALVTLVAAGIAFPAVSAAATPSRTGEGAVRLGAVESASLDPPATTTPVVVPMYFPLIGAVSYTDTFLACRGTGCTRRHLGQDLMGPKMRPLVATFSGTISYLQRELTLGQGNIISLTRYDGAWTVNYLHVNNDTPGTDDGKGTQKYAFLPGLHRGSPVVKGQLLGWSGDSGNAESTAPHLHFELRKGSDAWSGVVYNPIYSLNAAPRLLTPLTASPHQPGELVRWLADGPVMLLSPDGRRAVPPSMMAVYGWTAADVVMVTFEEIIRTVYRGIAPLRDGSIVASPPGVLWAVAGGLRYPVTAGDLTAWGLSATGAISVTADTLTGTPLGIGPVPMGRFRSGAMFHEAGNPQMWLMERGAMHQIHQGVFGWWGIPAGQIASLPVGTLTQPGAPAVGAILAYKNGTIYRTTTKGTFMMVAGVRRQIVDPNAQVYYNWRTKRQFWLYEALNAMLPLGAPIA